MKRKKIMIICAVIAALLGVIVLTILFWPERWSLSDPRKHYASALEAIGEDRSAQLSISIQSVTKTPHGTFKETSEQLLMLNYDDTQFVSAYASQETTIGMQVISLAESYQDDMVYVNLDGNLFCGSKSDEDFLAGYAPAILLTAENYRSIEGSTNQEASWITFTDATAPESWAIPEDAQFISSSGRCTLSKDDTLMESHYSIEYVLNGATVTKSYTVRNLPMTPESEIPVIHKDDYLQLSDPDIPILIERVCGYLLQAEAVRSTYDEYIFCQAFGDERTRAIQLEMENTPTWSAKATTSIHLENSSRVGSNRNLTQTETMENGVYTVTANDVTTHDPFVSEEDFQSYCRDLLVGTVILPQHLSGVTVTPENDLLHLEFVVNHDLAEAISSNICQTLYQDPMLLTGMASHHDPQILTGHLTFDPATLLPVSSGIRYKGIYTITDLPYLLEFTAEQTYEYPDRD